MGNIKITKENSERLYYLDWLRVFAILIVFFVHCSKIFDYHTMVVVNSVRSPALSIFREFALLWVMPFFFVVSGAAVYLSSGFLKSKISRILIPSVLVGTFVINPPYVYIEKLFGKHTVQGFFDWYPTFFDGLYIAGGNFAPWGMGTHIWYMQFLFIFSLILIPLFFRGGKSKKSVLTRLAVRFENMWALFFLALPVALAGAMFEYKGLSDIRMMGSWDPLSYLFFFAYGYMIYSNAKIKDTIKRYWVLFLIAAIGLTGLHLASHFGVVLKIQSITRHDLSTGGVLPLDHTGFAVVQFVRGIAAWCWCIALIGFGARFLNVKNNVLTYSNEAVLPFYMLHHTVIYIIGYTVIGWNIGVGLKFSIISLVSFLIIMGIYETIIRRLNILRILFGMKKRRKDTLGMIRPAMQNGQCKTEHQSL